LDIEQEIDASYEETLRVIADVLDAGTVSVTIHPDFLRDLADELERLRIVNDERKSTIATLEQHVKY
jgi:hypothetical protein